MNQISPQQPSNQSQGGQNVPLPNPQSPSISLRCRFCGAENRPKASFCVNCGKQLRSVSQPQHPQGNQQVPAYHQDPQTKKPRTMSKEIKIALITTAGTLLVAIISSILAPIIINHYNQVAAQQHLAATATTMANSTSTAVAAESKTVSVHETATAVALENPYDSTRSWNLVLMDPLTKPFHWTNFVTKGNGDCHFDNGYHLIELQASDAYTCEAHGVDVSTYGDLTFQVGMIIVSGDCGGLLVRDSNGNFNGYESFVCQDGSYDIYKIKNGTIISHLASGVAKYSTGLNQPHIVAVEAIGHTISLYVDMKKIATVNDNTYLQGSLGMLAVDRSSQTEVVYTDAKVWIPR